MFAARDFDGRAAQLIVTITVRSVGLTSFRPVLIERLSNAGARQIDGKILESVNCVCECIRMKDLTK